MTVVENAANLETFAYLTLVMIAMPTFFLFRIKQGVQLIILLPVCHIVLYYCKSLFSCSGYITSNYDARIPSTRSVIFFKT